MKMDSFLPTADFTDCIILKKPSGGIELALALPENARKYCITAVQFYQSGEKRAAKELFLRVLKNAVSPALRRHLRFYSVPQLARLASYLLNAKFSSFAPQEEEFSTEAFNRALRRLLAGQSAE
jgi:hypothetical protein